MEAVSIVTNCDAGESEVVCIKTEWCTSLLFVILLFEEGHEDNPDDSSLLFVTNCDAGGSAEVICIKTE